MAPELRYYPLTLFKTAKEVLGDFQHAELQARFGRFRLAAIHSFAMYIQYEDITHLEQWQKILSIKAMKAETKSINYLSTDGIKLLLEQPDTMTSKGRRDLALLALMYDTGAHVQEIIDLTPNSVRITSFPYTIKLFGKDRKFRIVPLMEKQVELLK